MRVLVCGSRRAAEPRPTWDALDALRHLPVDVVIVGDAGGVDKFAADWARHNLIPCLLVRAYWDYFGRSAGPIRNGWMLQWCAPDLVLALPGGAGTRNMVKQAERAGLPVTRVGWE